MILELARARVWVLDGGRFALDGGAMFGVVPKPLWSRQIEPDDANRIPMGTHPLLVETSDRLLLCDTGLGAGWDEKARSIYRIEEADPLAGTPFSPDDVTLVVNTHLHFDHAGGDTHPDGTPRFARARYVVSAEEWHDATHSDERTRASYLTSRLLALRDRLDLVVGDTRLSPSVELLATGGHTAGHQALLVRGDEGAVLFPGDLVPMRPHVHLPFIMAYDTRPLNTLRAKRRLFERALAEGWTLVLEHDESPVVGHLAFDDGRWSLLTGAGRGVTISS